VTHRQRPESAKRATFVTLEDETGYVNSVIWQDLGARQRKILLRATLMGIAGKVQREADVIHVVARNLLDYTPMLGDLSVQSRDFR
jgi:error-prone DNA polymerase